MNIYYSRSNNVDDSKMGVHIETFLSQLPTEIRSTVTLTKHQRGTTYSPQQLEQADLVIVGMHDMESGAIIGKGCYSEIEQAMRANKPVIVFHKDDNYPSLILAQTFYQHDLCVENSTDYQAYGSINLFGTDDGGDRYLNENSKLGDCCYIFPITNQRQVHLFITNFVQKLPEMVQKQKDTYDFGDELVFVVNGEKYPACISGDWLEIQEIGNMEFFKKLGFESEEDLGRYLTKLLVDYGGNDYDDVTHWPMRNREAMNIVIKSFMQMAKDINFHASNQATVNDSTYVPKYQFDTMITINNHKLKISSTWIHNHNLTEFYESLGLYGYDQINEWIRSLYDGNSKYSISDTYDKGDEKMKDYFIDALYARAGMVSRAPRHFVQPVESNYSHSSVEDDDDLLLLM